MIRPRYEIFLKRITFKHFHVKLGVRSKTVKHTLFDLFNLVQIIIQILIQIIIQVITEIYIDTSN